MSIQQWTTDLTGLSSLSQSTAPLPIPGDNEVLVEIRAVSLNYRDIEGIPSLDKPPSPCPN